MQDKNTLALPDHIFTRASDIFSTFHPGFMGRWGAWIVLLASLLITFNAWYFARGEATKRTQARFDFRVKTIETGIYERLQAYEFLLRGGSGLFATSDEVTREDWRAYVTKLQINQYYPGIQGVGFAKRILPSEKAAHLRQIRDNGFPQYTIKPDGERPEYTSIIFIEPFDWRNQRAFGYDMFSEPTRKEAMIRARDTGIAALSGKVTLLQETAKDIQSGFLIYLAVYRKGEPLETPEQRRKALMGYVYSPFRMNDFMKGILLEKERYVELQIFDGDKPFKETLLYRSDSADDTSPTHLEDRNFATHQSILEYAGHRWLLSFVSSKYFEENISTGGINFILVTGITISLLLFGMVLSLSKSHSQAIVLATTTVDLEKANIELREEIMERERTEEEIKSAKSFIDRVVDMSPFAMWISDRKGTVIRTNSSLRETLNIPDDKIVGQYNVLKDENLEIQGVMPMVMAVFENHEPANFIIPWKAVKAGDVNFEGARDLYIDVSIFPIVSAEGELTNVVCQWVDITENKKNEESLRESHEKFKSIVDNIGIGVSLISPAMEILEMNHQMREWFPEHDLDKRPICYRTFNNPPRKEICEYCPTCKTLEDGKVHEDTTVTPQAGKTRNYRIVSSPLTNSQGEVTAAIEMVEDITERLNLQAQLIQAQKMESVGLLAGGIAHDYNNISSIITGYSELALEKVDQDDPLHDDLIEILTAAKRSTDITRQLLAFARQQTIAPKVLDLNDTIESMLKMLRRLIGEDIDLAWLPGAEVWPVKIDPSQVDQILANLCVNARDAIAGVGKITIETKNTSFDEDYCANHAGFVPGEYVLFAVSDDGSGIAPETLDKIFEPFFTTKDLGHGTGLGLATVYGIVKQNNGFINIYSEPDEGTTIKIYLSRHKGEIEAHHKIILKNPISRGETVLLVEDDSSIMKLGKRMLNGLGYSVLSANTPSEAISLAKEHADEINLLVTDVVMPEMNGRELSEQLKRLYPNLKILFMSGYTANVIAHRGVLEDGVCFMPKPFSQKDLAVKVREALDMDTG